MTPTPIGSLTLTQQTADAAAQLSGARPADAAGPTPEQVKAAKDFEAIFIRQLLSSLEKSSGISGGEQSGGAVFRSMMVNALADKAAEGGGIGLRDLITRAMLPPTPQAKPELSQALSGPEHSASLARAMASSAGTFQFEALDREPETIELTTGNGSERLGVTSRVLTQARSSPMLPGVADGAGAPPTRPKGNR